MLDTLIVSLLMKGVSDDRRLTERKGKVYAMLTDGRQLFGILRVFDQYGRFL